MHPRLTLLVALVLLLSPRAFAQALLKPTGTNAAPLILKALDADVRIAGPVATTTLNLRFANPHSNRIEADFVYTLPEGGVATGFAYWYGAEKVVARIAEKERAAMIYKYITTRQRDPALVELIGKNTLRARIFPIMPNADLQVELQFARALPREKDGSAVFTLPIALDKTAPALENFLVKVSTEGWKEVKNNLGLEVNAGKMEYVGQQFRPNADLRLRLTPKNIPLSPMLHAAPSGGKAGFFTLTMAGQGKTMLSGLPFYDVRQRQLGDGWLITGRYKGAGTAKVTRQNQSAALTFGAKPEPNGPAVKLWSSEKLQALGNGSPKEAIALSLRHGIVCAHTSWIAIPEGERQRYEYEKQQAELDFLANRLVKSFRDGRKDTETRARFNTLSKQLGRNASDELSNRLDSDLYSLADGAIKGDKKQRSELARLSQWIGVSPERYLGAVRQHQANQEQSALHSPLDALLRKGQEDSNEFRELLARNDALAAQTNQNLRYSLFGSETQAAAYRIATARLDDKPDPEDDVRLLERIKKALGRETNLSVYRHQLLENKYRAAAVEWFQAMRTDRPTDEPKARVEELAKQIGYTPAMQQEKTRAATYNEIWNQGRVLLQALQQNSTELPREREKLLKMLSLVQRDSNAELTRMVQSDWTTYSAPLYELARVQYGPRVDQAKAAELEAKLKHVETLAGITRPKEIEASSSGDSAEEKTRKELLAEYRIPKPNPARIEALKKKLTEQTAMRRNEGYAKRRVDALVAEAEWDALERSGASPAQITTAVSEAKALRARFGDPLLPIDAPKDARQIVARFADGTVKPLAWNEANRRWELRFDVPPHATEGSWDIQVTIVHADGHREERTFPVTVDMKAPEAKATLTRIDDGRLRLDVQAATDASRATAFLEGAEPVTLTPTGTPGQFFALLPRDARVTQVVVTDSAHNRTELTEIEQR
ncbi:MAG: VIT domain-containing protein [Armatimonas sp.]